MVKVMAKEKNRNNGLGLAVCLLALLAFLAFLAFLWYQPKGCCCQTSDTKPKLTTTFQQVRPYIPIGTYKPKEKQKTNVIPSSYVDLPLDEDFQFTSDAKILDVQHPYMRVQEVKLAHSTHLQTGNFGSVVSVPEPNNLWFMVIGLAGIVLYKHL